MASRRGARCSCAPQYRAEVYSRRERRRVRKTFSSMAEAKAWRADAQVALRAGTLSGARSATLTEAAAAWVAGARGGSVRNRSGDVYKPSVVRGYNQALRMRVLPEFGRVTLAEIRRADLQKFVDRLLLDELDPSTIRNTLLPVRAIFRRAVARGEVAVNPTTGLEIPAVRGRRERIASPAEARKLLGALEHDRALWATALFSGLRMGELRALEWDAIDFDRGLIHVRRSWITSKVRSSRNRVPAVAASRSPRCSGRISLPTGSLAVGRRAWCSVALSTGRSIRVRSTSARGARGRRPSSTGSPCTSAATPSRRLMTAAGVNAKALAVYMGHASVMVTFDLYGHLMPGNELEAAALLDRFLEGHVAADIGR